jgi:hypothetical protein
MVTFIAGDGARLKSTITLDIAARITRRLSMPDGTPGLPEPADVIVLSTEDDLASVIVPRLKLAGADLERVSTIKLCTPDGEERDPLVTPRDLAALTEAIQETGAVLVVFDPLAGFTDGATTDLHRNDDTRRMMAALQRTAEATNVAILAVHHFSRAPRAEASHRLTGSLALVNAARSVLVVGPDPGDPSGESMVLALSDKANLAPRSTPSLSYRADVPEGSEHPRIVWCGPSSVTSRDLAAAAAEPSERGALDEATDFLREQLATGAVKVGDLQRDAKAAGITQRTLERAKQKLGIRATREGSAAGGGWWTWSLPEPAKSAISPSTNHVGGVSEDALVQANVTNAAKSLTTYAAGPSEHVAPASAVDDRRRREAEILASLTSGQP